VKTVLTEARLTIEIARTMIFPAAVRYQSELAATCTALKQLNYTFDTDTLDEMTKLVKGLQDSANALEKSLAHHSAGLMEEAKHICHSVVPGMLKVREYADKLEGLVADDLWPLPTYQEMLFIK
jgi:glutamine synthetase